MIAELRKLYHNARSINVKADEIFAKISQDCRDAALYGQETIEVKIKASPEVISRVLGLISFAELEVVTFAPENNQEPSTQSDTVILGIGGWANNTESVHDKKLQEVKKSEEETISFNKRVKELGIFPGHEQSSEKLVNDIFQEIRDFSAGLGIKTDSNKIRKDCESLSMDWNKMAEKLFSNMKPK